MSFVTKRGVQKVGKDRKGGRRGDKGVVKGMKWGWGEIEKNKRGGGGVRRR